MIELTSPDLDWIDRHAQLYMPGQTTVLCMHRSSRIYPCNQPGKLKELKNEVIATNRIRHSLHHLSTFISTYQQQINKAPVRVF
jgi:hypothetical protein